MVSPNKASFTVNIDHEVKEKLDAYSEQLCVSRNWLCNQAFKDYLSRLPSIETAQVQITIVEGD
jgi:predicted transcriptional regulator